jgi:hypothetical protein
MTGVDARSCCAHSAFHVEAHAVSDRRFGAKAAPERAADCGGDQLLDAGAHRTLLRYQPADVPGACPEERRPLGHPPRAALARARVLCTSVQTRRYDGRS